jgi:hypothetical protein
MIKPPTIFIVIVLCVLTFLTAAYGLYRLSKGDDLFPRQVGQRSGILYFEGDKKIIVQQPFVINVVFDSQNQRVNAAGFYLKFDSEKLAVTDISTLLSFCQFYPEKRFDNRLGLVSLACGAPHPGFNGKNQLISITFTPLTIGSTILRVTSDSKLLLSDGKGTNILNEFPTWEVQIGAGL